jgi:O-6-methylguanine DNA methyltransferase
MEIVHTAWVESPIGRLRIASTERGVAYVELPHASGRGLAGWLKRCAPEARCVESEARNRRAMRQLLEYLEGDREEFDLDLDLRGTPFQRRVWEALREIPYGETRSYQELARAIRRPKAVRAVGSANGANPLSLIVPCHRVVQASGRLGGYGGGLDLKARLLAMESAHHPAQGALL